MLDAAVGLEQAPIVVQRAPRKDELVGFAVPDDHLPAALAEALDIIVVGPDDIIELALRFAKVGFEIRFGERAPIEGRVLPDPVLEMRGGDGERSASRETEERGAALQTEPEALLPL